MRDEQGALQRQIAELAARLEREFPNFHELADARPLTLEAAQKLLGEGEALVAFLVAGEESFVWAVVPGKAMFQRRLNIVVLDACRNNPLYKPLIVTRGLRPVILIIEGPNWETCFRFGIIEKSA